MTPCLSTKPSRAKVARSAGLKKEEDFSRRVTAGVASLRAAVTVFKLVVMAFIQKTRLVVVTADCVERFHTNITTLHQSLPWYTARAPGGRQAVRWPNGSRSKQGW